MKKYNSIYLLFLFMLGIEGCNVSSPGNKNELPPDNQDTVSIQQGIWGNIRFGEGDFMPTIDESSSGKITAVERAVYVYEATSDNMVKYSKQGCGTFYSEVNSRLILVTKSNVKGFFQASLAPGKYSIFVKENSLLYANEWDNEGHIQAATVRKDEVTERHISINYKAVY